MIARFFGQWLLENGIIDGEELLAGIACQERTNRKFGETAIALGLLGHEGLEMLRTAQRTEDLKLGELAVKLRLMTTEQVDQVLRAQANSHIRIGEALVETGAVSKEELARHLAAFKLEQEPFRQMAEVPPRLDPTGLVRPAVELSVKMLVRVGGLNVKLVAVKAGGFSEPPECVARVGFEGSLRGEFALGGAPPLCARLARSMVGEPVAAGERATILDAMGEFLNMVVGNLAAAAASLGKKLELKPPGEGQGSSAGKAPTVIASLGAAEVGEFLLVVSVQSPGKAARGR